MVGGGFLACFETSSASAEFGCNIYEDTDFKRRISDPVVALDFFDGADKLLDSMSFDPSHPRWTWRLGFEKSLPAVITVHADNGLVRAKIPVRSIVPVQLLLASELFNEQLKLRSLDSGLCLTGNPDWSVTDLGGGDLQYTQFSLTFADCAQARSFKWSPWSESDTQGYRLHTEGPSEHPDLCKPEFFDQQLCDRTCLDLAEFGEGPQTELFGCTILQNSDKAQRISIKAEAGGRLSMQVNARWLGSDG